jgi:hypothetical protein
MINSISEIFTGVAYLLDHWFLLYVLCPFIWLVSPAWDAAKLTLRGWLHLSVHGLRPYWFKSNYGCCSRTNAWKLRIHPRRRLSAFGDFIIKANVLLLLSLDEIFRCPTLFHIGRGGGVLQSNHQTNRHQRAHLQQCVYPWYACTSRVAKVDVGSY